VTGFDSQGVAKMNAGTVVGLLGLLECAVSAGYCDGVIRANHQDFESLSRVFPAGSEWSQEHSDCLYQAYQASKSNYQKGNRKRSVVAGSNSGLMNILNFCVVQAEYDGTHVGAYLDAGECKNMKDLAAKIPPHMTYHKEHERVLLSVYKAAYKNARSLRFVP
jgi:hypothetical protein